MGAINTGSEGTVDFPNNTNDVYGLIETLAVQNIAGLKSVNKIVDGFYDYPIENGTVVQENVIEMAKSQAYDKNAFAFTPTDPVLYSRHFNNFVAKQFTTTVRREDIRKIIADKGATLDSTVATILDTLTQGEGSEDFIEDRALLYSAGFKNYREILGGVPVNMKGVVYAMRDMYNHLKSNNSDLTDYAYVSATPEDSIRIALSPKVLNLIDVKELSEIFNMSKEELFGKIVVVDVDDLSDHADDYVVFAYDIKALGNATRLNTYTQDVSGRGLFTNHYLTIEKAKFHNGLFKGARLDCTEACTAEKLTIVAPATMLAVTNTLTHCTTTSAVSNVAKNEAYSAVFVPDSGYKMAGATATVTMGGVDVSATAIVNDGNITVAIPHVTGAVVIAITAVAV